MPRLLRPDMGLLAVVVLLLSIGVVMVYSASAIMAAERFQDPTLFLRKQLFWALMGSVVLLAALRVDYRRLESWGWPVLLAAGVLLVLVLVPPLAHPINGTRRWLRLGPASFQPAELAKLALVIFLAAWLTRHRDRLGDFRRGVLPPLAAAGALALLVLAQPDLGNCLTLIAVTFALLYLAGCPGRYLAAVAAAGLPLVALATWLAPYRVRRITAFLDPWSDPRGSGFQIIQSWLALGSGGLTGRGVGESRQKLFYLPEAHTDFIFAVIGEELGFVGAAAVVVLFAVLVWRGLRVGLRAPDPFGAYLALGLTVLLATETLVNLGVVTGLLPTKGLPLPFISFGGSALLSTMLAAGILINISQHAHV
ncbi:MAG TPA: putative lipid II flippase FtsW [Candidatus Binatia bacterium]|nr:putative lipid II flippase FtsW [Candidatus Binatia bacterium]